MGYTFEEYRRLFDGAVAKYEGQEFFSNLAAAHHRPAFPSAKREVAIFGIRHEGKATKFRENTADDVIGLARLDSDGLPQAYQYTGTTEPGLFDKVINPLGDFKMVPGFYFFKMGIHHGKNPCLMQDGPVLGERAKKGVDYNEADDQTWQITDGSLHIHAGIGNVESVGMWSAGCQVIAGGWEGKGWNEFFKYCKIATNMPIPYILVNEADVPALMGA